MSHSFLIVTAADASYFDLARGTIASVRNRATGGEVPIAFLDLGCTPEQVRWLRSQVQFVRAAEWEFDFPARAGAPEHHKGLLVRPYLRRYFPGYDLYLWIDADAWVQDWSAVELFLRGAARRRGLAVVPEIDRGSRTQYGGLPRYWEWARRYYEMSFGAQAAAELCSYPMLNAGVYALHCDAPHWDAWDEALRRGLQQAAETYMADQAALNLVVYRGGLFDRTELLPAWCNWTCHYGLPAWDPAARRLVEPYLPHHPIGILHLSGDKHDRVRVATTDLGTAEVSLRYAPSATGPAALLGAALEAYHAGQVAHAEQLCRELLQHDPATADAWQLLGVAAHGRGEYELALECLGKALALDEPRPSYHFNRGEVYRMLGRLEDAQACYERALQLQPGHAAAHNNRGTVLQTRGLLAEAEEAYRQAVAFRPDYALAWNNLGTILRTRGCLGEARGALEQALRLQPDYAEAHNNLGAVWHAAGNLGRAEACFREALRLRPGHATAHHNLGLIHEARGRPAEASACFEQAVRLKPDFAEAYTSLAGIWKDQLRFDEARAALEQALRVRPDASGALDLLATVYQLQGMPGEALEHLHAAQEMAPSGARPVRAALVLPVVYESAEEPDRWRQRIEEELARLEHAPPRVTDPVPALGGPPFFLAYQGRDDRDLHARLARIALRACPELAFVAAHCRQPGQRRTGRLRVGFVSNHFYLHTIGKLNLGLIRNLSREEFHVTLFCFPGRDDPFARQLQQSADQAITLPKKLADARRRLADEQLDVLIYTDIGMDALTYYLAFARLAPVQCVTWGHPVTTGIPAVDYFLSSTHLETPESDRYYTEKLIRLGRLNTYYYAPSRAEPTRGRKHFGLPEDDHLYVCPQTLYKLYPEFDPLVGAILRGDPEGRLVLIEGMHPHWNELLLGRFRRTIPDVADRVQFIPRLSGEDFLHLQNAADVLLDPIHFGGGNTSLEAFAVGTPVVTLPGAFLRSRITYACYRQMGLDQGIADNADDYVRRAVWLGTDRGYREQVRQEILARNGRLYEDAGAVRELEQFLCAARAAAEAKGPG